MLATETEAAAPVALITAELAMPLSVPVETMDASFLMRPVLVTVWTIEPPMIKPCVRRHVVRRAAHDAGQRDAGGGAGCARPHRSSGARDVADRDGVGEGEVVDDAGVGRGLEGRTDRMVDQAVVLMNETPIEAAAPVAVVETDEPWPARLPVVRLVDAVGDIGRRPRMELVTVWLMLPRNGLVNVVVLIALTDTDACAPVADSDATAPFARLPLPSVIAPPLVTAAVLLTCWDTGGGNADDGPRERCSEACRRCWTTRTQRCRRRR